MISIKNLTKKFGKQIILRNINFSIQPGEFVCITGASGTGKSTLLHIMAGAEKPNEGSVLYDEVNLSTIPLGALQRFRRRTGVVFQDYKLLNQRTVEENLAFPLEVCGISKKHQKSRVDEVLNIIDLASHRYASPETLSGGEKARIAIGRAIIHEPIVLFADEPTGNVDPDQSRQIMQLFKHINQTGTTIVLATHDVSLVNTLQPRVLHLQNGNIDRDSTGGYKTGKENVKKEQALHQLFTS